jgi:CRP-like cAMP-binding protein
MIMKNSEKHIDVALPSDVYRTLKSKCASESISVQDFVAETISTTIARSSSHDKLKDEDKDAKKRILNLFRETSEFNEADSTELTKLADTASWLKFSKGQTIFREQEAANFFSIMASGLAKIFKSSEKGLEFTIDIVRRGEMYGGSSIVSGLTYAMGMKALEDTEMVLIPKKSFLDFISENPKINYKLICLERVRIDKLLTKLIGMLTERADERIIKVLKELSSSYGNIMCFTHKEIADMSGTTSETVSRLMTNLRNRGALKLGRSKIQIIDENKLSTEKYK